MRILCLINARGGSKGVVGKNVRMLAGKPLIAWSIDCAKACPSITRIVVSTDCEEIADAARAHGAEIPFMRPPELATDTAKQFSVIRYTVGRLEEEEGKQADAILILQPTCPLRRVNDVEGAIALMRDEGADTVISVTQEDGGMLAALYHMDAGKRLTAIEEPPSEGVVRQQFDPLYHRSGTVYLIRRDVIMEQGRLYGETLKGYLVAPETAFNVDTPFDWALLEAWVAHGGGKESS